MVKQVAYEIAKVSQKLFITLLCFFKAIEPLDYVSRCSSQ